MTIYSVQSRERILIKGYEFLSFAKNMGKNIHNNISKSLSVKYSRRLLDHVKQSAADAFKTASKRVIQKSAWATGDFIGNKTTNEITKFSKNLQQNVSQPDINENDKEIPIYIYIYICKRKTKKYW